MDAHRADDGLQLRGGFSELCFGVGVFDDATTGPGTCGKAVPGDLGAADGNHVFAVARCVTPAHGAGVKTAVCFGSANKGLRGSSRRAANSWGGVTAHGKF